VWTVSQSPCLSADDRLPVQCCRELVIDLCARLDVNNWQNEKGLKKWLNRLRQGELCTLVCQYNEMRCQLLLSLPQFYNLPRFLRNTCCLHKTLTNLVSYSAINTSWSFFSFHKVLTFFASVSWTSLERSLSQFHESL